MLAREYTVFKARLLEKFQVECNLHVFASDDKFRYQFLPKF